MNGIFNFLGLVESFRMSVYFDVVATAVALWLAAGVMFRPDWLGTRLENNWKANRLLFRTAGLVLVVWTLMMLAFELQERIGISGIPSPRGFVTGLTVGLLLAVALAGHKPKASKGDAEIENAAMAEPE
jgi:hypothetical protein